MGQVDPRHRLALLAPLSAFPAGAFGLAAARPGFPLGQYALATSSLPCPSSLEIRIRAAVSMRRLSPFSARRGGPPAAGAFHPVIAS